MKTFRRLLTAGMVLASLAGCVRRKSAIEFITHGSDHITPIRGIVGYRHGHPVRSGNDLDFDGDTFNDLYVSGGDGTLYHTMSRFLIHGDDHATKRTWIKSSRRLEESKSGKYLK